MWVLVQVHKETKPYHCRHSCVDMEQTAHLLFDLSTPYTLQSETKHKVKHYLYKASLHRIGIRRQIGTISKSINVRLANVRPKTDLV